MATLKITTEVHDFPDQVIEDMMSGKNDGPQDTAIIIVNGQEFKFHGNLSEVTALVGALAYAAATGTPGAMEVTQRIITDDGRVELLTTDELRDMARESSVLNLLEEVLGKDRMEKVINAKNVISA